jgi:hypothetical protein
METTISRDWIISGLTASLWSSSTHQRKRECTFSTLSLSPLFQRINKHPIEISSQNLKTF